MNRMPESSRETARLADRKAMMTEREAWTAIADTLEMTGEMPPFNNYEPCTSLQPILHVMRLDRLISDDTHRAMRERMSRTWATIDTNRWLDRLFAPYGKVAPRILWARAFADDCE